MLEASAGMRRRAMKGAGIGSLVGAGLGGLAWIGRLDCDYSGCEGRPAMVLEGGFGGALWGLLIGALIKKERWNSVSGPEIGLSILPTVDERGAGISFSVSRASSAATPP
jgi:hypothetical protein